jgi:microcystin-dependent protein
MAVDNNALIQALIDGGITPAASRVIANAIANAATPQFSQSRDIADATPRDQLRLIDSDTRKYLLTNLDYSSEAPYQARLQSSPGQFAGAPDDHPYKDSQPVTPVPPLSKNAVAGGDYINVENQVISEAAVATVSMKLGAKTGSHLRINQSTKSVDAVPLVVQSPQGLVTGTITEDAQQTTLELVVRTLQTLGVVLADGTIGNVLGWIDGSVTTSPTNWAVPAGAVMAFANVLTQPSGWLLCNGGSYLTDNYLALFNVIGYSYGGSGSNFNVPDFRGHFLRGFGTHGVDTAAVSGAIGARQAHRTALPSNGFTGITDETGAHRHGIVVSYNAGAPEPYGYEGGPNANATTYSEYAGTHQHVVTINGGGDTETRPKNMAVYYYIKT